MGWETNVPTMISFYKESYTSLFQVESAIDDEKEYIKHLEDTILMYTVANPKDTIELDESMSTLVDLKNEVTSLLKELRASYCKLHDLELLKENYKCVSGDFIKNPDYKKNIKEWIKEEGILSNIEYYEQEKYQQNP